MSIVNNTEVAIIGMSGIFPGAGDVQTFWKNIENRVDAIQAVPMNRMDDIFFEEFSPYENTSSFNTISPSGSSGKVDRFYCRRGGFVDEFAEFDPIPFGILPLAVEGTEPDHLLTLRLAHIALEDASVFEKELSLEKTGIIIGKGNYAGPGATRAIEIIRTGEQIVQVLKNLLPDLKGVEIDRIKKEFQIKKGRFGADTAMGLIPNLVASLVANRLNLGGTAYTIDAACASSLVAVDHAIHELNTGRSDMIIAGGVHVCQNAPFWSIFSQLGALSRKQQIRPFDQRADGLLIGEGCGFVILKRLEEAIRDKHRIYAIIKGVGIASDGSGTSLMSPSIKGQSRAISEAWENARLDPHQIGYLEAHGTGTPLGDKTELETILHLFGNGNKQPRSGIGSVKSMIGHAMPAAGMAGLIKTALALHHGRLPPTLHCEEPLTLLQKTRFDPVIETVDWESTGLPRLAGINAFGFGGINAHVVLAGWNGPDVDDGLNTRAGRRPLIRAGSTVLAGSGKNKEKGKELLLLARTNGEDLIRALEEPEAQTGRGDYRLALFDPTPDRILKAVNIIRKNKPWRNRQDIWFSNDPLLSKGGKLAFLFPGLDALSGGEVESIARHFNIKDTHEKKDGSPGVFNASLDLLERTRILDTALKQLGVQPDLHAGHSLGEWLAGRSSGLITESSVLTLLSSLRPELFENKDARFLVAGCGYVRIKDYLENEPDIFLSNDNCPQQIIVCGTQHAIEKFSDFLRKEQIFHQILPFQSGFHSPFVKDKLDQLLEGMKLMDFRKASIPLWSATTLELYPEEYEAIRDLSIEHLVQPVRFRELIEKLYQEGVRMFIQIGSGGLTGFVEDTLKHKNHSALSASIPSRAGLAQLKRVLAALFVEGKETGLSFLGMDRPHPIKLQLGSPFVKNFLAIGVEKNVETKIFTAEELGERLGTSPLRNAFASNAEEIAAMNADVFKWFNELGSVKNKLLPFVTQLDVSLDNCPYLKDHSLVKQRSGWLPVEDMDPVIPMTMVLELFAETAREKAPGKVVKKIMHVQVFQWMLVASPFREQLSGEWKDENCLLLTVDKYARAEVWLSDPERKADWSFRAEQQQSYPLSTVSADMGIPLPMHILPGEIYEKNMFHGPAYQGIKKVKTIGDKGINGIIEGCRGKGSLLDNAGQLFGLWLQLTLARDRIAFPVKIQEVEFYGDMQNQSGEFDCTCILTSLTDEFATADFVIKKNEDVWCVIRGWQNRRLEFDDRLWNVSMAPLHNFLAGEPVPGLFLFDNAYSRVVSWDFILKRYFSGEEKKVYHKLPPSKKREWLISRVAAKDAVRNLLILSGVDPVYPIEFRIRSEESGRPFVEGKMTEDIHISIAHKKNIAIATARYGNSIGIDIEEIRDRGPGFNELAFSSHELELPGFNISGTDPAEWITRCWVAKEAYGKFLGKGLQGNPRVYEIEAINGNDLRIKDVVIRTIKHKNYIIGWTI
ncbi:type I polyketide synthase [Flavitalea flava]